jgi:uncharacterized protein YciI
MFAVVRERGGPWDWARPMEEQDEWREHARYMNELADEGFIVLGGPVGDLKRVLLAVEAEDEEEIHARLAADPWTASGMLRTVSVEQWTIRLDGRRRS